MARLNADRRVSRFSPGASRQSIHSGAALAPLNRRVFRPRSRAKLFQSIREDQGLAYTVYSSTSAYTDAGSALVYGATSAGRGLALTSALENEIDRFVADGVTAREVEVATTGFAGAIVLGLEDSGARMSRIANGMVTRGSVISVEEFLDKLEAVTVDDVNRVIGDVWGGPSITSLVGPPPALAD